MHPTYAAEIDARDAFTLSKQHEQQEPLGQSATSPLERLTPGPIITLLPAGASTAKIDRKTETAAPNILQRIAEGQA